jgi:hypothetical protein
MDLLDETWSSQCGENCRLFPCFRRRNHRLPKHGLDIGETWICWTRHGSHSAAKIADCFHVFDAETIGFRNMDWILARHGFVGRDMVLTVRRKLQIVSMFSTQLPQASETWI